MFEDLRSALAHPNMRAFLHVIRAGETGHGDDAYRALFGGEFIIDLARHPNRVVTRGALSSTAAGAYQFLHRTWRECADALALPDFSPASQDLATVFLIRRHGALPDVLAGRVVAAITKCNREWASLPGSPYGQPTRTLSQALATYAQYGGQLAGPEVAQQPAAPSPPLQTPPPPAPKEQSMPLPAILAAVLPTIIESIPKLGKLFGSGSEVAERNVAAAAMAVQVVQDAVGATNAQEASEIIKSDPVKLQAAQQAVAAHWLDLTEAGGDGIAGARKADQQARDSGTSWYRSPSFAMALLLMLPLYVIVLSLIGLIGTATWSDDVRAGLAGSIVSAILGGVIGYYFGQTTTKNRTPAP